MFKKLSILSAVLFPVFVFSFLGFTKEASAQTPCLTGTSTFTINPNTYSSTPFSTNLFWYTNPQAQAAGTFCEIWIQGPGFSYVGNGPSYMNATWENVTRAGGSRTIPNLNGATSWNMMVGSGSSSCSGAPLQQGCVTTYSSIQTRSVSPAATFLVFGSAFGMGNINPAIQSVTSGTTTTFTATPQSGHTLSSISGCGGVSSTTSPYVTGAITGECTVTAVFASNPAGNNPPTANAGGDRFFFQPTSFTASPLDGSSSSDPDIGDSLSYSWSQVSGPTAVISAPANATTFVSGMNLTGTYVFRLTVTDTSGASAYDDMQISILPGATFPDLTARDPVPSVNPVVGGNVVFSSDITNSGGASTVSGFNNLFQYNLSPSGIGATNISVNWRAALAAGVTGIVSSSPVSFPAAGLYYARTCADADAGFFGGINEGSNEGNNCSGWRTVVVSASAQPDLTVDAPTPGSAILNQAVAVASIVRNSGSASTVAGFQNILRVSNAPNGTGAITTTAPAALVAMGAGGSSSRSFSYTFPSVGVYSTQICADSGNSITESNELNNCSAWTNVTVVGSAGPDLMAGVSGTYSATRNVPVTFSANVTNAGTASTLSSFSNHFQLASGPNGSGTITDLSAVPMVALASGASGTTTSPYYTFTAIGTYSVRACADRTSSAGGGVINESNESNNCAAWTNVNVSNGGALPVPNLSVSAQSVLSGNAVTIYWSPQNSSSCTSSNNQANANWTGAKNIAGGQTTSGPLTSPTTFTLSCTGPGGGPVVESVTVTIGGGLPNLVGGAMITTTATTFDSNLRLFANASNSSIYAVNLGNTGCYTACYFFQIADQFGGAGNVIDDASEVIAGTWNGNTSLTLNSPYIFTAAGNFSARVCVDRTSRLGGGVVSESNEIDNCGPWGNIVVSSLPPDLTGDVGYTQTAVIGISTSIQGHIYNSGGPTGVGFPNFYQVATSSGGNGSITSLSSINAPALSFNQYQLLTDNYTFTALGMHSYRACADMTGPGGGGVITESNESNNCGPWKDINVTLVPGPDLTMETPTDIFGSPMINRLSVMQSNLRNIGPASTGGVGFPVLFQKNTGPQGSGVSSAISVYAHPGVAANYGPAAAPFSYTWPSTGVWSVRACADNNAAFVGVISEQDEGNNCSPWYDVVVSAEPLPGVAISANPMWVTNPGDVTRIRWNAVNADNCTGTRSDDGSWSPSGLFYNQDEVISVSPTTFTVTCTSALTATQVTDSVNVYIGTPPAIKRPTFQDQ